MVKILSNPDKQQKEYGLSTSILAGLGSGVFKIFEGADRPLISPAR